MTVAKVIAKDKAIPYQHVIRGWVMDGAKRESTGE